MAGNRKIVRYRKPFRLNIGMIVFGIIFFYMMYSVYAYVTSTHTSAYEVVHGTIAVNNTYTGLALRSEELIRTDSGGEMNYYRKDASKAGVGDLIYSVDSDGAIARQIQSASGDVASLDEKSIEELEQSISEYTNSYRPEAFYEIKTFKADLNAKLSEALNMVALNSIKDAVTAAEGNATFHKGTAEKDGIVVYYTDGYENVTSEDVTPSMFDKSKYAKENLKERTSIQAGDVAYKLITQENWQIVLPVTSDTIRQLGDASTVRIKFKKDNTTTRVPFQTMEKEGEPYLILNLTHSMIRFVSDRFLDIELLFEEESGLKIPNSAITTKDFFVVPMEYFGEDKNTGVSGLTVQKTDKNGNTATSFIVPTIYFKTEYAYYVDGDGLADGDIIVKPNSSETQIVHETAKLEGVYSINKGYAVFRQIDVIFQNEEYTIIRSGTEYGVSLYDHIALDGSAITEDALINK